MEFTVSSLSSGEYWVRVSVWGGCLSMSGVWGCLSVCLCGCLNVLVCVGEGRCV